MALIRYLKRAPGASPGVIRDVAMQFAKPLVDLGFAEYHTRQIKAEPKATDVSPPDEDKPGKKQAYKRREMRAEAD